MSILYSNVKQRKWLHPATTTDLILMASSVLVACSDSDSQTLPPDTAQELQGVWERSGYGVLLNVDGNALTVFEATRASCYLRDSGDTTRSSTKGV